MATDGTGRIEVAFWGRDTGTKSPRRETLSKCRSCAGEKSNDSSIRMHPIPNPCTCTTFTSSADCTRMQRVSRYRTYMCVVSTRYAYAIYKHRLPIPEEPPRQP